MNSFNTYLDKIHSSNLFVDFGYQRQIVKGRVEKMSKNFDLKAMTALVVSKRNDGRYAIIDGQHRFLAGVKAGVEYFVCQVLLDLSYEEEARIFTLINCERGPMKSPQQFKAMIEACDKDSIQIVSIVESHGFKIKYIGPVTADNEIKSINELKLAYKISPLHLEKIMKLLRQIWNGDKPSCTHHIIGGLSKFIRLYERDIDLKRLINVLRKTSIDEIVRISKQRSRTEECSLTDAVGKEFFKLYNKRLINKIELRNERKNRDNDLLELGDGL
jgi:hypothetical protein